MNDYLSPSRALCAAAAAFAIMATVALPGCGVSSASPVRAKVWGRVTWNGSPIQNSVIVFTPKDPSRPSWAACRVDEWGRFSLSGYNADTLLEPGTYTIFLRMVPHPIELNQRARVELEGPINKAQNEAHAAVFSAMPLPLRFTDPKTSGLEVTLTGQPQRVDVNLKD